MSSSLPNPVKSELGNGEALRAALGRVFNPLGVLFVILVLVVPIVMTLALKPILGLTAGFFFGVASVELGLLILIIFLQTWVGNSWVKIIVEECAAPSLPTLPSGTVVRKLKDSQGIRYLLLRLDNPIDSGILGDRERRKVHDLLLVPRFSGNLMDRAPRGFRAKTRGLVGIGVLLSPLSRENANLNQSTMILLAAGWIERAQWMGKRSIGWV